MATLLRFMLRVWLASASTRRQQILTELFPEIICKALTGINETAGSSDM